MSFLTIPPPACLSDFVRFFWVLECEVAPGEHYIYRSMADGGTELLFHYHGQFDEIHQNGTVEKSFLSGIHGQSKQYRRFRIGQSFGIFGVYLYPYAIPGLFNIPASELSDHMPDLSALWGNEGIDLEEKMMQARDNKERLNILSSFLTSRLKDSSQQNHPLNSSIRTIIQANGQISIGRLANMYCLSTRQFERKFKELSGFSPKLYSRIVRFQAIFKEYDKGASFSEMALNCGYYDQSHFIHDFKLFSGYNPKQFFSGNVSDTAIWSE